MVTLGHLDNTKLLSGIGLGTSCALVAGLTVCWGINAACDALISQAAGAKNYEMMGVWLNRVRFVTSMFFLPMVLFAFTSESILVAIGQDAESAKYAQEYMVYYLPGFYFQILNDCQIRYLNMQGKT